MRAQIAIVGGGAIGAFVAAEAARRADPLRSPVVLVEEGGLDGVSPPTACSLEPPADAGALRPGLADGRHALKQFELATGRGIGFGRPGRVVLDAKSDRADLSAPAFALGLEVAALEGAAWDPEAELFDPVRLHSEVLSLGRTRGLVTRPGVRVEQVLRADGRVSGLETNRGRLETTTVLITDPEAARRLLPGASSILAGLEYHERFEQRIASHLFEGVSAPVGAVRGSVQELFEAGNDPESLEALFGGGEALEYPHPVVASEDLEVFPDPLSGELVIFARSELDPGDLRESLARLAPVLENLGAEGAQRRVSVWSEASGLPIVGELEPGLFLALGLGLQEAQLAAGLGPGLVALMHGEPVAAFDPELLAPAATRRARS